MGHTQTKPRTKLVDASELGIRETHPRLVSGLMEKLPRLQKEFVLLERLGGGSFGDVFKAVSKTDHRIYAVKCMVLRGPTADKLARELGKVKNLVHPNVVATHAWWMETVTFDLCLSRRRF